MNFDFSDDERRLRAELREFLERELPADWVGVWHDADGAEISARVTALMAEKGWLTYYWAKQYGGMAGSIWAQTVIQEELFARHEPRGSQYMGVNWIGHALMQFGTEAQKDELLPAIAAGRAFWAQLFSEPEAGSDLAALRTTARREGDEFVVDGQKIWTSYANVAEHGFLLARTNPSASRHAGMSCLLIDMRSPGIEVREIRSTVGWHRFHEVTFTDLRVPASSVLGEVDSGWAVAMASLPHERVGNARYARTTRVLTQLEDLLDAEESADESWSEVLALGRSAELLNYRAADLKQREDVLGWQASAAFAANAMYEQEAAGLMEDAAGLAVLVAVHDDHRLINGEAESFAVRQAPTVTIQAGTYQVQLSIIGRGAFGFPRAT